MTRTPQVGDVVHGTVKPIRDGLGVEFQFGPPLGTGVLNIHPDAIIHIEPAPLKVGDRVTIRGVYGEARIRAIDGKDAWLKYEESGRDCIERLAALERLP